VDHYRTLQVSRHAEQVVIERAYKALCLRYHPDTVPAEKRAAATTHMQQLNEAYRVLSDPTLRRRYDATLGADGGASAWDQFWEKGLLGLFTDRFLKG
jgi:DnaJ-class molecular chaperone